MKFDTKFNPISIWAILTDICKAKPNDLETFQYYLSIDHATSYIEYRFQGALGFGGKVWLCLDGRGVFVTCYSEDETPERLNIINKANKLLKELTNEQI